ncbi:hypothetical protein GSI_09773 [Ganoderma sinense ZZ0214-1]|uniref:Uncharacterized protein n=1 Tax=Ganoderma sinense ZZ0214-1 TaxID=1077348 RepID=A0A2G8S2Z4_9APHY|nr:hypothetical protein GSI_09773 [Ganoderma sinense ZZ0214-1]
MVPGSDLECCFVHCGSVLSSIESIHHRNRLITRSQETVDFQGQVWKLFRNAAYEVVVGVVGAILELEILKKKRRG